jgi:undecaprenyl-diphosphatase
VRFSREDGSASPQIEQVPKRQIYQSGTLLEVQVTESLLLGILQGIAEWLPISSEGQTMLVMIKWLGMAPDSALSYAIFLHIGTMFAALIKFRHEFVNALRNLNSNLARIIIISTFCTGITALPLYFTLKETFKGGTEAMLLIGVLLIANGLLMWKKRSGTKMIAEITALDAAILGIVQGFAVLPGVSRSGTVLTVLLMRSVRQDIALIISFMISVPAVIGALVVDYFYKTLIGHLNYGIPIGIAASMLVGSFAIGYLSMDLLILLARKIDFSKFCIAFGLIAIIIAVVT